MLERALDDLAEAVASARVPLWRPPASLEELTQLEVEIAPLRLPDEARRFWSLVDVATLRVHTWPRIVPPIVALTNWRQRRDEFKGSAPLVLVDIAYENHRTLSIELDVDEIPGGALFEWDVSDADGFTRRFNRLAEWIEHVALLLRSGLVDTQDRGHGPVLEVPGYKHEVAERAMRTAPAAHPTHGTAVHVEHDPPAGPRTGSASTDACCPADRAPRARQVPTTGRRRRCHSVPRASVGAPSDARRRIAHPM